MLDVFIIKRRSVFARINILFLIGYYTVLHVIQAYIKITAIENQSQKSRKIQFTSRMLQG